MKKLFIIFISLSLTYTSFSQNDYKTYVNYMGHYFDSLQQITPDTVKIPGYKNYIRHKEFWDSRVNYSEEFPNGSYSRYVESLDSLPIVKKTKSPTQLSWEHKGPFVEGQYKGIITSVFIDEAIVDANGEYTTYFAGTSYSGLWKTINKGNNWYCITDQILNYGVGVTGIDKASDGALYIITGEQRLGYGTGIYRSVDNGETWENQAVLGFDPSERLSGNGIAVDPTDSDIIYALINSDLYRTIDRGLTWHIIFEDTEDNFYGSEYDPWMKKKPIVDIEINPIQPNEVIIVANQQKLNNGGAFSNVDYNDLTSTIWRTGNANTANHEDVTWERKDDDLNLFSIHGMSPFVSRYTVAQVPGIDNKIYLAFHYPIDNTGEFATDPNNDCTYNAGTYIYESSDFGATFSSEPIYYNNITNSNPNSPVANGNLAAMNLWKCEMSISHTNKIFLGGLRVEEVNIGNNNSHTHAYSGSGNVNDYHHVDVRALKSYYNPNTSKTVSIVGNDGGVSVAIEGIDDNNFQNINGEGLEITQFYGLGNCESLPDLIMGGTQDNNGFVMENGNWDRIDGGDCYDYIIEEKPPYRYYHVMLGGGSSYLDSPGNNGGTGGIPENAHIVQYPNNFDKILAAGSHSLIRTTDYGVTWEDIYSDTSIPVESDRKTVSCMDICSTQDNHVWFAHKGAIGWSANYEKRLFKTDNANPSLTDWEDLTANVVINGSQVLRSKYITDILNHPTDPQTVWIALSGFGNGQSSMSASLRVLKTSNGGTSWTDISDGLNLMPVNVLKGYSKDDAFHLLLGNDEGVYQLLEGSSIWERISDNIPANVNVRDIEINYSGSLFRIATFGRGIWEAKIPCQEASGTLDITQNTTWLNDKWLSQNIKVKSGNILTLKGRLRLMSNAKIWVEPGAQLIVNGGSLTSACEDMWYGIILLGNPSLSQSANNQGRAYFLNNAIVSNAEYAVSNLNRIPGDGLYPSGGVIQASNSTFRNNKNDIELSNYRHINIYGTENVNISSFYNCIFETTDSYGQTSTNPHVRLHKVNLNKISGNTFEDKRTDIDVIQDGRIGLYTYKSGYILDQICTGFPPPTDCDGDRNQFLNLKYGVKSYELSNPAQFTVQVKNSTFTDCARGIYLMNIPNSEILKNSIVFEDDIIDYYGLYLDFCTNYHIEENVIGYYQNTGNVLNAANNVVGAIVKNQHSENTSVYRNTFNRLAVGTEAIGQNKHSSFNTGLRIQCNEYNNGQTDIFVKEDPNNSTKGIALNQGIANGETDELAGNLFTDIPSGTIFETRRHIINGTNCATFNYHHHKATGQGGVPRVKPTYTTGSLSVNEETTQYNPNSCPDHIDTGGGIIIGPGKSLANEQLLVVEETKAELAILVDGGNTTELKNDVIFANTQDAYDKYSDLMSKEGYISEEVLEEVAAKETGLNKAMVRDVLVANTHAAKSVKVQAKLEQRLDQLPDYMRAQIQEGLTSLSSKEYLELRKAKAKARHDYLINKSVRGLLKDSVDRTENLLTLLSNTGDLGFEYRKLAILDAKDRTVEAEQVLAHMQTMEASTKENENLQDFVNLRTLLNQWKQEGKNMNALVEADINTLKVYSSKNNKAAARAMGVLAANGQLDYLEPVYLPEEAENRSAFRKWSSEGTPANEQDLLKLYPNPAKNYFTVEYSFTSKDKPIVLKVTDVQGKIVYTKTLQYQQDELLIDAKAFQQGTYYVSIFAGKKVIKTKKLKSNK